MHKNMVEKVYEQLIQEIMAENPCKEYLISTIYSYNQDHTLENKVYREVAVTRIVSKVEYSLHNNLIGLKSTSGMKDISAVDFLGVGTGPYNKGKVFYQCLATSKLISYMTIDASPKEAVLSLLAIDNGGDNESVVNLKDYYVVVSMWDKDRLSSLTSKGVNLYQYVNDRLAGL